MTQYTLEQMMPILDTFDDGANCHSVRILDYMVPFPVQTTPIVLDGGVSTPGGGPPAYAYMSTLEVDPWLNGEPTIPLLRVSGTGELLYAWTDLMPIAPEDRMMEREPEQNQGGGEDEGKGGGGEEEKTLE